MHLFPHRQEDGTYIASKTKNESDYVRVRTLAELIEYHKNGYSIRMSNPQDPRRGPSLIISDSIEVVDQ